MTRRAWAIFLIAVAVVFVAMESCGLATGTFTLSQSVWYWTANYWTLALAVGSFAAGLLVSHFWWANK